MAAVTSPIAIPSGIPMELSASWHLELAGQIPEFIDAFFMVGVDPETERFVGSQNILDHYVRSTSEKPTFWNACRGHVLVLASVRVHLRSKSEENLKAANKEAFELLQAKVWKSQDPDFIAFRNKFAEDMAWARMQKKRGGVIVERIDPRDFQQIMKGRRV